MKFDYTKVASVFSENNDVIENTVAAYEKKLQVIGGIAAAETGIKTTGPLVVFVATGGTENQVLSLFEQKKKSGEELPVFLIAYPMNNSLPACLEALARLQQDGANGQIFYLKSAEDETGLLKIRQALAGGNDEKALENSRIGLLGEPSDWLVASMPKPETVKEQWGADVIEISINELKAEIEKITDAEAFDKYTALHKNAVKTKEPVDAEIKDAVKMYLALKKLAEKYQLSALTIKCFDLILDLKVAGCFALSQLSDDGIISGCEGDLVSTVGMLWAYKVTGKISWMANPSVINEEENRLTIAHCTVPRNIVGNYDLRSHFESGMSVAIQGIFPEGAVTLFRIGGKNMDKLWITEGELLRNTTSENLCRTQVEIQLKSGGQVSDLLHEPLGNHLVMVQGYWMDVLK